MTGITPLTIDNATGYYDGENQVLFVDYQGTLTLYVITHVLHWLGEVLDALGGSGVLRGAVFDFRQVTDMDNLSSARNHNGKYDLSQIPTAIIARNVYQERVLGVTLPLAPQQKRQRIVTTMQDALAFVEQFHHLPSAVDS